MSKKAKKKKAALVAPFVVHFLIRDDNRRPVRVRVRTGTAGKGKKVAVLAQAYAQAGPAFHQWLSAVVSAGVRAAEDAAGRKPDGFVVHPPFGAALIYDLRDAYAAAAAAASADEATHGFIAKILAVGLGKAAADAAAVDPTAN